MAILTRRYAGLLALMLLTALATSCSDVPTKGEPVERFCQEHPDDPFCQPSTDVADGVEDAETGPEDADAEVGPTDDDADLDAAEIGLDTASDADVDVKSDGDAAQPDAETSADAESEVDAPPDCSHLDGDCVEGTWNSADGSCFAEPLPGGLCDDANPCTLGDLCQPDGSCEGTPKLCDDQNPCTLDDCDHETGLCGIEPVADGSPCDDDDTCTTNDQCSLGACSGALTTYERTFGSFMDEVANDLVAVGSDGFAFVGNRTTVTGSPVSDVWLVRLDGDGEKVWEKEFGDDLASEVGNALVALPDGFAVAGQKPVSSDYDMWLIRTDIQGTVIWDQLYDHSGFDEATDLALMEDGGFVLAGQSVSGGMLAVRTDSSGGEMWTQTYKLSGVAGAKSVFVLGDHSLAYAGFSGNSLGTSTSMWLVHAASEDGVSDWNHVYSGGTQATAESVLQTSTGFALAGWQNNTMWWVGTDASGGQAGEETYGGTALSHANAMVLAGGGFVMAGDLYQTPGDDRDAWIVATDSSGLLAWQKSYGGANDEVANAIVLLPDGYLVAGYTESTGAGGKDAWLIRTDLNGEVPCDAP